MHPSPSYHLSKYSTQTLFLAPLSLVLLNLSFHAPAISFVAPRAAIPVSRCTSTGRAPPPRARPSSTMARRRVPVSKRLSSVVLPTLIILLHVVHSSGESDAEILLKFRDSLKNNTALSNWNAVRPPCNESGEANWKGILCYKEKVWGLQLENMGLNGIIDVDALAKLGILRTISFMNNNFEGPLPNFSRLGALKSIYLSHNKFSGEISNQTFAGMDSLKKLHLADNKFSGSIPATFAGLPRLKELMLDGNEFEGEIPNFPPNRLKEFNVSQNKLSGEIPRSLRNFNASSFSENKDLCEAPLKPCPKIIQNAGPDQSRSQGPKLSVAAIVIVVVLVLAALSALAAVVIILCRKKNSRQPAGLATRPAAVAQAQQETVGDVERGQAAAGTSSSSPDTNNMNVQLTFLKEGGERFDLTDLLKAAAEVLGSGVFGSTYKAALSYGKVMVVKRFKYMNDVNREEFGDHMRRLGRLSRENVLPIVAFYSKREEKLLVTDYVENFSLAVQLHGNRSRGHSSLDWPTRLNVVKGIAKGLQHLYNELPSLTTPHGHLKSSNVLLDGSFRPLLTDYGLVPIVNQENAPELMISYKSPEYRDSRRVSKKTDIWSFGILILEILTGRFPSNLLQQGSGSDVDLAMWVESVMRNDGEGGGVEVLFDKEMAGTGHCQGEIMKLLKIGLSCSQPEVDKRPDIREVVEKIDEIKERDVEDDFYSTNASEADIQSSRGLSVDFNTINI